MHQIYVTNNKVHENPSVESTETLFVLRLMQTQFTSKRWGNKIIDKKDRR